MNIDTTTPQINLTLDSVTENYDNLINKPQINGVTLTGNKTPGDLGLGGEETWVLINEVTISQDDPQNSVEFLKDSQGNDFSLKKFRLVYSLNTGAHENTGQVIVNDCPNNRYIGNLLYVNYYYNSQNCKCFFETLKSYENIVTMSFNLYGGGVIWRTSNAFFLGTSSPKHFAPFYRVYTKWGTATYGTVELWGVK